MCVCVGVCVGLWPLPHEAIERRQWCLAIQEHLSQDRKQRVEGSAILAGLVFNHLSNREEYIPKGHGQTFEINWRKMTIRALT